MAKTDQDASLYHGETVTLKVPCVDADNLPLPLAGLTLFYRVARKAGAENLLEIDGAQITIDPADGDGATALILIRREDSLTLPVTTREKVFHHELYCTDGLAEQNDDVVLMTGALTVLPAQIAQHDVV